MNGNKSDSRALSDVEYNISETDDYILPMQKVFNYTWEEYQEFVGELWSVDESFGPVPTWVYMILILIGLIGNIANIVVFTRPSMITPINILLSSLEVVNIILFITYIPGLIRVTCTGFNTTFVNAICDLLFLYVETVVVCISNWFVVSIGLWRLIAVGFPLKADYYCSRKRTLMAIAVVVVASLLISLPFTFVGTYDEYLIYIQDGNASETILRKLYVAAPTEYTEDPESPLIMACYAITLFTTSVPCFSLTVITCLILWFLWDARAKRNVLCRDMSDTPHSSPSSNVNETRITITLIVILCMFQLAYLPDAIANVHIFVWGEKETHKGVWHEIAKTRICMLISNCLTFFVYFFMSKRYRETFKKVFVEKYWRTGKASQSDTKLSHFK